MIGKYYNSILEQTYKKIGKENNNIVLVNYSNDYSILNLEIPDYIKNSEDIFFEECEFAKENMSEAYAPFLGLIRNMFQKYRTDSFELFLDECHVYSLHKPILLSYMESGFSKRGEQLLYNEVFYEKELLDQEIIEMLVRLSKEHPFLLLLNRLQMASTSTLQLLVKLMKVEDSANFGIVLGMNESKQVPEYRVDMLERLTRKLEDRALFYRIGTVGTNKNSSEEEEEKNIDEQIKCIHNIVNFLDLEHATYYLEQITRRLKFENYTMSDQQKMEIWDLYAKVSIYLKDLAKALEISKDMKELAIKSSNTEGIFNVYYIRATVRMYQGKLKESVDYARKAVELAKEAAEEFLQFKAELLEVQAKMSGWDNIFFCTQNVNVSEFMIEKLVHYQYLNHLAYIYIYAYDNKPEIVAKAYRSESQLIYFSKGIDLAKKIGNEKLVYNAYQKNIMLAASNGMYEIAILYSVRTFESLSNKKSLECGRVFSGLAYNLSALGQYEKVTPYFRKAVEIFYDLNCSEDIAEVFYNMAINNIGLNDFKAANECLIYCVKAVEKLGLNSLRVCNLSKLYAILALCNQKMGNPFVAERYLEKCRQFLSYVFEKEANRQDMEVVHDYAKCEDDAFLYYFALALYQIEEEKNDEAFKSLTLAEKYLMSAEGNEFFCYRFYRQTRKNFFERTNRIELMQMEQELIDQFDQAKKQTEFGKEHSILNVIDEFLKLKETRIISNQELEKALNQESIKRAYVQERQQMNFISTWQKLVNVINVSKKEMVENAMQTFLYHFNVDRALYIQYHDQPEILYNDTQIIFTEEDLLYIKKNFEKETKGFVVAKVNSNYAEHRDIIDIFGTDNICSMVAIPFFDNRKVTSILITYVLMKDNWHSSVNRYMLNERDLSISELLFREVQYSINRLEANEQIYEMNKILYHSAVTDQLTGLLNRKGFYKNIDKVIHKISTGEMDAKLAIMFIDLDNFKGYNDNFGHDTGDLILKLMAKIFEEVCGDMGFVTRYGGDEFIIILYTDDKKQIEEMAQQIYREIRAKNGFLDEISSVVGHKVEIDEKKQISCSIGINIANTIQQEEDVNEMIKQADDLLYKVKKQKKGTYKFL